MRQDLVGDEPAASRPPIVAAARTQRRPLFAVLAGLLILLGAAGGALVFLSTGSSVEAVAARVSVARGQVMTAEMFTTVQIAPDQQLSLMEASELPLLLGKRAAHDVAAGSLVSPEAGMEAMVPGSGRTVVGLSLPPGAEPAIPLLVGDRVRVILTEPAYACAAGETTESLDGSPATAGCTVNVVIPGTVVATARDEASGQVSVSVDVAAADAPRTAAAAALGRAALVLDSRDT
ncbi:SAF domain-containing protein [Tessaracoccus bendigoensis DSM 12906]|uniref:SAF domain-containing protein n=1 Tax=Tessaracoccus bendigoensis DSM 12906 TaxID=1123357 RepID=A0A1M6HDV0_9ACTN|nr:SAF domain-containing protein [Tessaracoccus bendigoensis]SHJ20408.1 SAF domain-containing protein [Tessaracoccus bendigoensis DSM 12906]